MATIAAGADSHDADPVELRESKCSPKGGTGVPPVIVKQNTGRMPVPLYYSPG